MQKAHLAAALAATMGLALHGTAFAADNGMGVTEKTTKTEKSVKIAKGDASAEKGSEASCKGKDGSCKGKDSSCKGKDAKTKKHSKKPRPKKPLPKPRTPPKTLSSLSASSCVKVQCALMPAQFKQVKNKLPSLGVGLGLRRELAGMTFDHADHIDWLEFVPENSWVLGGQLAAPRKSAVRLPPRFRMA